MIECWKNRKNGCTMISWKVETDVRMREIEKEGEERERIDPFRYLTFFIPVSFAAVNSISVLFPAYFVSFFFLI